MRYYVTYYFAALTYIIHVYHFLFPKPKYA